MKIETHAHTKEGSRDSLVNIENTIATLKEKDYDGMIVTDHNSYNGYNSINEKHDDFVIIKGIEYDTSDAGHMIIVLPNDFDTNIFTYKGMSIKETIKVVKALKGIIGPAHPFDYYKLGILNNAKWLKNQDIIKDFDFIEGFNSCGSILGNHKSKLISKAFNKPIFGGSDSHKADSVGNSATILPEHIKNENELIELVKSMKYGDTDVNGSYYNNKTQDKLGFIYTIGLATYYGVNLAFNRYSRRKAIREALTLSLI